MKVSRYDNVILR